MQDCAQCADTIYSYILYFLTVMTTYCTCCLHTMSQILSWMKVLYIYCIYIIYDIGMCCVEHTWLFHFQSNSIIFCVWHSMCCKSERGEGLQNSSSHREWWSTVIMCPLIMQQACNNKTESDSIPWNGNFHERKYLLNNHLIWSVS